MRLYLGLYADSPDATSALLINADEVGGFSAEIMLHINNNSPFNKPPPQIPTQGKQLIHINYTYIRRHFIG